MGGQHNAANGGLEYCTRSPRRLDAIFLTAEIRVASALPEPMPETTVKGTVSSFSRAAEMVG